MKLTIIGLLLAATTGSALADGMLYSTEQQDYTIEYTEPSGKTSSATLYMPNDTLGYMAVPAKPGKPTPIVIKDPDGTVLLKSTVIDNRSYVVMGTGKRTQLVATGLYSQTASTNYQGVLFISALPGTYSIDLFGDSGQGGVKGVRPTTTNAIKSATKLPASDNRYKADIHLPDGTTQRGGSSVDAGYIYIIHKTRDGKVTASAAGYLAK